MPTNPSVRTVGTAAAASSGTVTLTVPTCTAGDMLLAFIADYPTTTAQYNSVPARSGWTLVKNAQSNLRTGRMTVLSRVAVTADSGSTAAFTGLSTNGGEGVVIAYQGAVGVDVVAGTTGNASATATAPAVTTTRSADLIVDAWTFGHLAAQTLTPAATNRVNVAGTTTNVPLAVSDQTQTSPGTTTAKTCTSTNSVGTPAAVTVALYPNQPPNAPTVTTPTNGSTIDRGVTQRFNVPFSDDPGDTQSALDIRYSSDGGTTWTTVSYTGANQYIDVAGGTLAAGSYQVQGRSYDSSAVVSAWGPSTFFTAADAPTTPTITAPAGGATVGALQTVTWTATTQTAYQLRRVADVAGSADPTNVYSDTGAVFDSAARSLSVDFPTNARYEHVQVRIQAGGLWSAWADVRVLVSWAQPPTPVVVLTADDTGASITVAITNPAPNLLSADDASLEGSIGTWANSSNATVARDATVGLDGAASLKMTSVAAGTMTARTATGTSATPVTAGQTYTALASARAATVVRNVHAAIVWFNASGTLLSTSAGTSVADTTTGWTEATVTAVAPAGAAFAEVDAAVESTGGAGEIHNVDEISLALGSDTTWRPGGTSPVATNDIYRTDDGQATQIRVATGLATGAVWTDYTVAAGVDYQYHVTATAANGTTADSGWTGDAAHVGSYGYGY